jgi:hypothetical protein
METSTSESSSGNNEPGAADASAFRRELQDLINRESAENGSHTPDFVLAEYLEGCLRAFDTAVGARDRWYGWRSPLAPRAGQLGVAVEG